MVGPEESSRKSLAIRVSVSANVLKEELSDLKQVIMIYSDERARTQITHRSSVQQRLWDLFDLGTVENQLTIH